MITDSEIETILARLAGEQAPPLTARQAIALLLAGGYGEPFATELVFTNLGGSDLIQTGADGIERYFDSGKTVAEVDAAMAR